MSYEVRIGILALVAVALSLWGVKYIQGTNLLSRSDKFYAYYDDVAGVQIGTPVQVSGVTVGSVSAIDLDESELRVKLTFTMNREVPLPTNTKAMLVSTSLMGGQAVFFAYDKPCSGANCAENGSELVGVKLDLVESFIGEGGLDGQMQNLSQTMMSTIDSLEHRLLGEDAEGALAESLRSVQSTLQNLQYTTGNLNTLVQRSTPAVEGSLRSVNTLLSTLEAQRHHLANLMANADSISQQMTNADLGKTIDNVNVTLAQLGLAVDEAKATMTGLNGIVGGLQNGEGSLGKLLSDEELYQNLSQLSFTVDSLLSDLEDHPYRYVPLKSRRRVQRYDRLDGRDE